MTAPTAVQVMQDNHRAFVSDNTSQFASLFEQLLLEDYAVGIPLHRGRIAPFLQPPWFCLPWGGYPVKW